MVEEVERKVRWAESARRNLRKAIATIKEDSPKNARKVKITILQMVRKLPENPQYHPPDRFKIDNTGNFRAFEKYSYWITYEITDTEIHIIRFRHVRQEPIEY